MSIYSHLKDASVKTEFSHLDDQQLRDKLKNDHGYICGPITPTTRFVYESLLEKKKKEKGRQRVSGGSSLHNSPSSSSSTSTSSATSSAEKNPSTVPYSLRLRPSSRKKEVPRAAGLVHQVSDQSSQPYDQANYHGHYDRSVDSVSEWTSYSLVVVFCLFFSIVALFYLYSRINFRLDSADIVGPESLSDLNINWDQLYTPLCGSVDVREVEHCLKTKDRVKPSHLVLRYILYHIEKGLIEHHCSGGVNMEDDGSVFPTIELRKALQNKGDELDYQIKSVLPQDEISRYGDSMLYLEFFDDALGLIETNEILKISYHKVSTKSFLKVHPDYPIRLPLKCRLTIILWRGGKYLLFSLMALLSVGTTYWLYSRKKRMEREDERNVVILVEKCIELLQSPDEPKPTLVNNIRDTLLTANQRKDNRWKKIWASVVDYIETHEHRVKATLEEFNGEEFKTWKWYD